MEGQAALCERCISPKTMEWGQADPGKSATEFSVLIREARWHLYNLDFAGPGDDQVSGRTHLLPLPLLCPTPTFMPFYMLEKFLLLVGSQGVTQAWFESQIPALPFTIWIIEQASSTSLNLVYLFCKMQGIIMTYFLVTSYDTMR